MKKWYVEYRTTDGKYGHMGGIVAADGKEAIEIVKSHVYNAVRFKVFHDDES